MLIWRISPKGRPFVGRCAEHMGAMVKLCGAPTPIGNTRDCPRERGHDGEHYCWGEGHISGRRYGITVMTFDGERVAHYTMEGKTTPEELCALIAFSEVVRDRCHGTGKEPEEES